MELTLDSCWDTGKDPSLIRMIHPLSGLDATFLKCWGVVRAGGTFRYRNSKSLFEIVLIF